jgi:hypothetical protein
VHVPQQVTTGKVEARAREVGLQDGTYQQIYLAAQLQKQLDVDADRS